MDIRDILKSFDQLSEATTTTDKGTVHKSGPGGYGNRHGSEEVTDQYGKPKGKVSLSKMNTAPPVKRGKGRPPNPDKAKSYDSTALSKAMGVGKAPKPTGKPSVKHSLKEYFDHMDEALNEAGLAVQPMPATPQQKQQQQMAAKPSFMIKDPSDPQSSAITTSDPAVVDAAKKGTMTMQEPGDAPTAPGATPAAGAGSQVAPMKEEELDEISDELANRAYNQRLNNYRDAQKSSEMVRYNQAQKNKPENDERARAVAAAAKGGIVLGRTETGDFEDPEKQKQYQIQQSQQQRSRDRVDQKTENDRVNYLRNQGLQQNRLRKAGVANHQDLGNVKTGAQPPVDPSRNQYNYESKMEEDGENWIKGAIKHPGAFTNKASSHGMTPKEFANKVLAHKKNYPAKTEKQAQLAKTLGKMHEAEAPPTAFQSSPLSTANRSVLEGGVAKQGFVILDPKLMAQIEPMDGTEVENDVVFSTNPNITAKLMAFAQKNPQRLKISSSMSDTGGARPAGNQFSQASGPDLVEGKKGVNPFAKKDTKKKPDDNNNNIPDYAEDGKGPHDTKKKGAAPKKGVNPFAKKTEKKKVKEGMEHYLQAARLEGKSHALRKMPYNCTHDNMEEARCYHEGFKEGLDECYGQMPILGRTRVGENEVGTMASYGAVDEGMGDDIQYGQYCSARDEGKTHEQAVAQIAQRYGRTPKSVEYALNGYPEYTPGIFHGRRDHGAGPEVKPSLGSRIKSAFGMGEGELDEMNKTAYMIHQAIETPGKSFNAFGQTMSDKDVLDKLAFEALDKQLNAILEGKEVSEGMTVSISKGQQGSPDSVSVSAQDGEADQLLSIIKSAGMGLFGGDEHNGYGAPQGSTQAPGGIEVVDDHDGMMALMKKLTGGGDMQGGGDYEDEEGHEGHSEEGHMHGEEEPCNECGYMESKCQCDHGDEPIVDETESRDQMAYEVAEANAPNSGADNTNADVAGNAATNSALATADAGEDAEEGEEECEHCHSNPCKCDDEKVEEGIYESYANSADDTFEADIDFMTKVISGGLNKQKSTGQTTIPVIAGQKNRMGADGLGKPMKESTDLLKDYRKLSGL